ncbi:MAG: hypothetical protein ABR600_09690 [Actinomycetota bacterium]
MSDVSLRARFERFPATVKGAFVVRGEDSYPHQVVFLRARVVRVPGPAGPEVPVSGVTLDVPPHRDVFVPFEFPVAELEPGWYGLEADVEIDGAPRMMPGGKRFCVPWPRGTVRSASLRVDRTVEVSGAKVSIERCQSGADGLSLRFVVRPPQEVTIRLFADGSTIDLVEQEVEPSSGKGIARGYPLLKSHRALRIDVGGSGKSERPAQIELSLDP